jgi:hypothetical protein
MKEKTKTKKASPSKSRKEKHYPAVMLALVLAGVLMLEGLLLGAATPSAWQESLQILDISQDISLVVSDTYEAVEPMLAQIDHVTEFYEMAATEMMVLLDASDSDPFVFVRGVSEFYQLASVEMEQILDFSDQVSVFPRVAGSSISR